MLRRLVVPGCYLATEMDFAAGPSGRDRGEWSGASIAAQDREFGLRQQRQEVGTRREQLDLDHPVGHRNNVLDRPKRVLEWIAAALGELPF